jgi:hypothetical protein
MTFHDTKLPSVFDEFARQEGFSTHADVIPSASGGPLETDLSPEDFAREARELFREAHEVASDPNATVLAPY